MSVEVKVVVKVNGHLLTENLLDGLNAEGRAAMAETIRQWINEPPAGYFAVHPLDLAIKSRVAQDLHAVLERLEGGQDA